MTKIRKDANRFHLKKFKKPKQPELNYRREDYKDSGNRFFKPGNPGRPKGIKTKGQLVKEKLFDYILQMDFDATNTRRRWSPSRKKWFEDKLREIPLRTLLQVGAALAPREMHVKGEGFEGGKTVFQNIVTTERKNESIVQDLNDRFMSQFRQEK